MSCRWECKWIRSKKCVKKVEIGSNWLESYTRSVKNFRVCKEIIFCGGRLLDPEKMRIGKMGDAVPQIQKRILF